MVIHGKIITQKTVNYHLIKSCQSLLIILIINGLGTSSGLVIYKGGNFKILNTKNKLPSNKIREIIIIGGSNYIATEKGVLIISVKDTIVINKHTQKIPDENIICIQVDDDENMWIGTNSGLII